MNIKITTLCLLSFVLLSNIAIANSKHRDAPKKTPTHLKEKLYYPKSKENKSRQFPLCRDINISNSRTVTIESQDSLNYDQIFDSAHDLIVNEVLDQLIRVMPNALNNYVGSNDLPFGLNTIEVEFVAHNFISEGFEYKLFTELELNSNHLPHPNSFRALTHLETFMSPDRGTKQSLGTAQFYITYQGHKYLVSGIKALQINMSLVTFSDIKGSFRFGQSQAFGQNNVLIGESIENYFSPELIVDDLGFQFDTTNVSIAFVDNGALPDPDPNNDLNKAILTDLMSYLHGFTIHNNMTEATVAFENLENQFKNSTAIPQNLNDAGALLLGRNLITQAPSLTNLENAFSDRFYDGWDLNMYLCDEGQSVLQPYDPFIRFQNHPYNIFRSVQDGVDMNF